MYTNVAFPRNRSMDKVCRKLCMFMSVFGHLLMNSTTRHKMCDKFARMVLHGTVEFQPLCSPDLSP